MAVALRGVTQGAYLPSGSGTIAWPAGTVAGDLGVVCLVENGKGTPDSKPMVDGWQLRQSGTTTTVWYKRLTTSDLSAALPVQGYAVMLQTMYGAGKLGNATTTNGAKLTVAGAGLLVFCRAEDSNTNLTPTVNKLHSPDIVNAANSNRRHNVWFYPYTTTGYKSISSNGDYLAGFEVVPLQGPSTPVQVSPTVDQQVDAAEAQTFAWQHKSTQGVPQDEFQLRIREVGSTDWYYVTTGGTLTTTVTSVATSVEGWTVAAAALVNGKTYEWQVATKDSNALSSFTTSSRFTTAARPVVTSITVSAPANDLTPTVSWTGTTGLGPQVGYRVHIYANTGGRLLWDSGARSGSATSITAPNTVEWSNGEALRAYVQFGQGGGLWSVLTPDDVTFAVTWTPPAALAGVYAIADADRPLQVVMTGVNPAADAVEVSSSVDGQATWQLQATLAPTSVTMTVDFPQAVYGQVARYRARQAAVIDGVRMWSPSVTSLYDVASRDKSAYLVSMDGSEWLRVRIREDSDRTIVEGVTVSYGLGSDRADVHRTPPAGETGRTVFACRTKAERVAVEDFLTRNLTFQIRWSPEVENHKEWVNVGTTTMQRTSPLSESRLAQYAIALRDLPVEWVEQ